MDERLLDGVLGSLPVSQDEAGDGKEAVSSGHRDGLEGLVISAPRRFHDIALHRLLHRLRDHPVALHPTTERTVLTVQKSAPKHPEHHHGPVGGDPARAASAAR